MTKHKPLARGLASSTSFVLIAFLSIGLAIMTHHSAANTLSSLKIRAAVAAPSQQDMAAAAEDYRLDTAMKALSWRDAALYRTAFMAQKKADWAGADRILSQIVDRRLIGHVLADRFEQRGATGRELEAWLQTYPTLPDADVFYKNAVSLGVSRPTKPVTSEAWRGAYETDSAPDFGADLEPLLRAKEAVRRDLARSVSKDVRQGQPLRAMDRLMKAEEEGLPFSVLSDLQAVVASACFMRGQKDCAQQMTQKAAQAGQPLALWTGGLIAWKKGDAAKAMALFDRLAGQENLSATNKAAAHFWAYRSAQRLGDVGAARNHLVVAAATPRSFYGLLAAHLMGRRPIAALTQPTETAPVWNRENREILAQSQAGWRALALLQIGQKDRAEAELRRFSPQNDPDKQQAMLALANYVSMPALVLQISHLSDKQNFDRVSYPLLPWKPAEGFQIDRALLFALARHESLFDPSAVSLRGAQGLMQIMPATARHIMGDQEVVASEKMLDPAYNMALGQKYVQQLVAQPKIGKNLVLILASYNAGPTKTLRWMSEREGDDPLLFIESLPARETRNYVERVLPHYWAYRARLGHTAPSLTQMAQGQWPFAPLEDETPLHMAAAE